MASNKLKVGDKVKYVSGRHGWCDINPRDEIGVITQTLESHPKERSHTSPYKVKWEAGPNSYHEGDLELISSPQYTPITPKVGEKYRVLKSFEQSNEQYSIGDVLVYVGEFGPPHARYSFDTPRNNSWNINQRYHTTEYLELVEEPAPTQLTTGKGFLSSTKLSDLPANQTITVVDNGRMHWTMTEEEPINQSIIKKTMNFIKKSLLSKDDKNLIKAGYMDDNMNLTSRGREALEFITFTENKAKLVEMAEAQIAEDKEDKE